MATINLKAAELRTKLFNLINEFKDLQMAAARSIDEIDRQIEATGQLDQVACDLATIHENLPWIFTDVYQDSAHQRFAQEIQPVA